MKKLYTLFALVFSILIVNAQGKNIGKNPTKSDPEAKKILDAVSNRFKTYKSPQATFTYQVENGQGKVLSTKKGSVVMKGNKYKVTMNGTEIYSDGSTVWNFDKSSNEVTVDNINLSGTAMTPQKMFTNFYDKDFYYKTNGEKKESGKTLLEIELTPTDKTRPYHKVYVYVDKATNTIFRARFLEKTGGRYSYTINTLKTNANVPDSQFTFDKTSHPGVELVDLR